MSIRLFFHYIFIFVFAFFVCQIDAAVTVPLNDKVESQGKSPFSNYFRRVVLGEDESSELDDEVDQNDSYLLYDGQVWTGDGQLLAGVDRSTYIAEKRSRLSDSYLYHISMQKWGAILEGDEITLDGKKMETNPIANSSICLMKPFGNELILVPDDKPGELFIQSGTKKISILSLKGEALLDAQGKETSGIVALEGSNKRGIIFAAVAPSNGYFGQEGSGIALIRKRVREVEVFDKDLRPYEQGHKKIYRNIRGKLELQKPDPSAQKPKTKTVTSIEPVYFNNQDATDSSRKKSKKRRHMGVSAGLSAVSRSVRGGKDGTLIGAAPIMHWNEALGRLFIGLQVKAGNNNDDAVCAIAVARVVRDGDQERLEINSIVPEKALSERSAAIGVCKPGAFVSVNRLSSMYTSTMLHYLIVQSNNSESGAGLRSIYALPLVGAQKIETEEFDDKKRKIKRTSIVNSPLVGTLAAANEVEDVYTDQKLSGRIFTKQATLPADASLVDSQAALVGQAPLVTDEWHYISDMKVANDVVYASVALRDDAECSNSKAGLFHSQAIFDHRGVIVGWTPWKIASGIQESVSAFMWEEKNGSLRYVAQGALQEEPEGNKSFLKRTIWSQVGESQGAETALYRAINDEFKEHAGGIQGLVDCSVEAPVLNAASNPTLLVATGDNKVVVAQTGFFEQGAWHSLSYDMSQPVSFANGTTNQLARATVYPQLAVFSGGGLSQIKSVVTAAITDNGRDRHLFVGGSGGLAVLAYQDGSGWGDRSYGLRSGMSFKILGDYSFVRKVISDERYLYVLTNKVFERIDLAKSDISRGYIHRTVLTKAERSYGRRVSFADAYVNGSFALLATSQGLMRVGNWCDVRTNDQYSLGWVFAGITDPVVRITSGASAYGHDKKTGIHQILVLSASVGGNDAHLYRFYLRNEGVISDMTLRPLPDMVRKDQSTFFVAYGGYRYFVNSNGASMLQQANRSALTHLPNKRFVTSAYSFNVPLSFDRSARCSQAIICSGSGRWLVASDNGLLVHD